MSARPWEEHPLVEMAREAGYRQGLVEAAEPGGALAGVERYMWVEWPIDDRPPYEIVQEAYAEAFASGYEAGCAAPRRRRHR